jgi:hypothetical protein
MYDNLLKHQAEEIARLRAEVTVRKPEAEDEIRRLRNELVCVTRELGLWKEFVRSLKPGRKLRREINEFLAYQEDING